MDATDHWNAYMRIALNDGMNPTFETATPEARAWAMAKVQEAAQARQILGIDPSADIEGERLFPEVKCIGKLLLHARLGKDVTDPSKDMEPFPPVNLPELQEPADPPDPNEPKSFAELMALRRITP